MGDIYSDIQLFTHTVTHIGAININQLTTPLLWIVAENWGIPYEHKDIQIRTEKLTTGIRIRDL